MEKDKPDISAEELKKRARRAQESLNSARKSDAKKNAGETPSASSYFSGVHRTISSIRDFKVFRWLRPIVSFFGPKYSWAFSKLTLSASGKPSFSRQVGSFAALSIGSVILTYFLLFFVVPNTLRFSYDAFVINVFAYEDVLVFGKPDWVEGEPGVLSVFACRRYPCEGQSDSIEFRMRDSFYLDVVRTITRLEPHDPGELAGAFLSEENACRFKAYGKRIKYFGIYPDLIEATCRPINGENAESALENMRNTSSDG